MRQTEYQEYLNCGDVAPICVTYRIRKSPTKFELIRLEEREMGKKNSVNVLEKTIN